MRAVSTTFERYPRDTKVLLIKIMGKKSLLTRLSDRFFLRLLTKLACRIKNIEPF